MLNKNILGRFFTLIGVVVLVVTLLGGLGWMLMGMQTVSAASQELTVAAPHTATNGTDNCFVSINNSNTTDYSSPDASAVQTAVDSALPNDSLKIAGTCTGVQVTAGISQTAYIDKDLTLQGGYTTTNWTLSDPDINATMLDAASLGRVVVISATAVAHVENLTITGGQAGDGGGIFVDTDAALTLNNSQVLSNTTTLGSGSFFSGGGLGNLGHTVISGTTFSNNYSVEFAGGVGNGPAGSMTIEGSTFSDNSAANAGGALGNLGWVTVTNSIFISNTGYGAGAVGNLQQLGGPGWMRIENSTFLTNTAANNGGAIDNDGGELHLIDSTFIENSGKSGGAIYNNSGSSAINPTLFITSSTFLSNTANNGGGGVLRHRKGTTTINGSTFSDNTASDSGGAILVQNGSVNVSNSTIAFNSAATGGGIDNNANGNLTLENSTVSSNTAALAGGILNNAALILTYVTISDNSSFGLAQDANGTATMINSISANNGAADCDNDGTFIDGGHNIIEDGSCITEPTSSSGDPLLDMLADNGGSTETHALLPGSPAIDRVPPVICSVPTDQRGVIRPYGSGCDSGSYEVAPASVCFVESNGDNITDFSSADALAVQTAVDAASPDDLLKIAGTCAGTQTTNGQDRTVYISQTLTLEGGHTPADWSLPPDTVAHTTILDAEENGGVVYINGNHTVTMTHLTIQNGQKPGGSGAGIYNNAATLYLSHSNILSNTLTNRSGGLYNNGGHATINQTFFFNNSGRWGGGVASLEATTLIQNSYFLQNHATDKGGAIHNQSSTVIITDTILIQNQADNSGGAIANGYFVQTIIANSIISDNIATDSGGGIYSIDGAIHVSDSAIVNNIAKNYRGGGIYIIENSEATLTNVTISGNQALGLSGTANDDGNGGGIYVGAPNEPNTISVTHSTITQNYAAGEGGGMDFNRFMPGDTLTFVGTILAGNSAGGSHQDCYDYDTANYTFNTDAYNLFSGSAGDDCPVGASDLSLTALGLTMDDVLNTSPPTGNSGDTLTHALLAGSPALDVIPAGSCSVTMDQRGINRPQNTNCDIGAYELWSLHIGVVSPSELDLTWENAADSCVYDVYEETMPYFTPTTVTYSNQNSGVIYPQLGDVATNYFYVVEAVCGGEATAVSNEVGEFDFAIVPGS